MACYLTNLQATRVSDHSVVLLQQEMMAVEVMETGTAPSSIKVLLRSSQAVWPCCRPTSSLEAMKASLALRLLTAIFQVNLG